MEENGLPAMEGLKAATYNIAAAYQKDGDLGSLEPGKIADLIILTKDPLQSADSYQCIAAVMKAGDIVDREALPQKRVLTSPPPDPSVRLLAYRKKRYEGGSELPCC